MLNVPDHPYGREVKGYLSGRVAVPGPWLSVGRKPGGGMYCVLCLGYAVARGAALIRCVV
jgi:hypothetical protein